MELRCLITGLSDPAAYPHSIGAETVEVRQTHISVVFLAGPYAYKVKKPVDLGFLDFSTLEKRRHFCEEEVRLNRRLAPTVYLGVVPVTPMTRRDPGGGRRRGRRVGGEDGAAARRGHAPERLRRGEVGVEAVEALARRIAAFHARAEAGPRDRGLRPLRGGGPQRPRELRPGGRPGGHDAQPGRLRAAAGARTEAALARPPAADRGAGRAGRAPRHARRPAPGPRLPLPRPAAARPTWSSSTASSSTSGSASPTRSPTWPSWSWTSPFHGRRDLARAFADAYFRASGDERGPGAAAVLHGLPGGRAGQGGGDEAGGAGGPGGRAGRGPDAGAGPLAAGPGRAGGAGPAAVPGAGRRPARHGQVDPGPGPGRTGRLRGDPLGRGAQGAGRPSPRSRAAAPPSRRASTRRSGPSGPTPSACAGPRRCCSRASGSWSTPTSARRPGAGLPRGGRPLGRARRCSALPGRAGVVRARLARRRDDASDADWSVYLQAAERWEGPGPRTRPVTRVLDTGGGPEEALARALDALREIDLWCPAAAGRGGAARAAT